ncbi:MAG: GNAT family N-acetyltransferase [Pedobacter sp.]|nr:MAG: GNAT family N-acetyltransferase [Pedobacter sp.]
MGPQSNYYSIKRLLPSQWKEYKSIRLEALITNPEMFGSNYATESHFDKNNWISLLEDDSRAMFALYYNQLLVGVSGIKLKEADASTAIMFASFIKSSHRRMGLSKLIYEARIDWAVHKKCKSIIISHRSGNISSKAANQNFRFVYSHAKHVQWPDGVWADELFYLLDLTVKHER